MKYKSLHHFSNHTNISWTQFRRYCKVGKNISNNNNKLYKRKLNKLQISVIQEHILSEESSFPLPDRKYAGKRFMQFNMKRCWNMYNLLDSTTRKVSLSTFYWHKPKFIKLKRKIPLRQSCCEKCLNFENVIKDASKFLKGIPSDINACVDSTTCAYEGYFPKIACILWECEVCSLTKLKERLLDENNSKLDDTHKRFMIKEWVNKTREYNGKTQSYLHWDVHRCTYSELIDLYIKHVSFMAEHTFIATWNYCQFKKAKKHLEGDVLIVNDFAQNYFCLHQNEPQGMHWEHKQVTLHPTVAYFKCPNGTYEQICTHEAVHVSENLKHDAHLVKSSMKKHWKYWKKEMCIFAK